VDLDLNIDPLSFDDTVALTAGRWPSPAQPAVKRPVFIERLLHDAPPSLGRGWRSVQSFNAPMETRIPGKYHSYDEMLALLRGWAAGCPELCDLESIGLSPEGRELWLLTLTSRNTGAALSKPAYWAEANTHAGEVTGTEACLQLIDSLVTKHAAADPSVVALLESSTVYVLPRIAVDGAEKYLTTEYSLRSSPLSGKLTARQSVACDVHRWLINRLRVITASDQPPVWPGLVARDIDGNGELLMMRIKDEGGSFKKSTDDPRVMVPRGPAEYGGEYYKLMPEGEFSEFEARCSSFSPLNNVLCVSDYSVKMVPYLALC
jgi:hypothetical protein